MSNEPNIQYIELDKLKPNPYQPESRREVPEETAKAFADSILQHGLIQIPIARMVNGEYQIGDGWLRRAGFAYLLAKGNGEFKLMPVQVKELSDQQMADLVMEANTVRKDLSPIELAQFFKRYLEDFKVTQAILAQRHSCSQGEIANTIRLLELPADIQQEIISQKISATHGLQLLRLNVRPELQAKVAKASIEEQNSVVELDQEVNKTLWHESKSLNPKGERYNDPPVFDLAGCKECPNKTRAAEPWNRDKKEDRCLDPQCWEKKQQATKKELLDKAWQELKDKGDATKIVTGEQLSYSERESLENYKEVLDNPAECDQCLKTALFKYYITDKDEPMRICTDPACYRKKKTKRTKDDNILRKQEDKALTLKIGEAIGDILAHPRECLLLLARKEIKYLSAAGRADLLTMFSSLPRLPNGRLDLEQTLTSLDAKTFDELLALTMLAYITTRRRVSWETYNTKLEEGAAADFALITGASKDKPTEKKATKEPAKTKAVKKPKSAEIRRGAAEEPTSVPTAAEGAKSPLKDKEETPATDVFPDVNEPAEHKTLILEEALAKFYGDAKNPLIAFQNANCPGCYFAIKTRIGSGEKSCVMEEIVSLDDKGRCQIRRSKGEI